MQTIADIILAGMEIAHSVAPAGLKTPAALLVAGLLIHSPLLVLFGLGRVLDRYAR